MKSDREKSYSLFFLSAVFLLGVLNLLSYPYISFSGVILTSLFILLSFAAVARIYGGANFSEFQWIVFTSFNFTVLLSRVFVNTTGIGTPKSIGSLGPFTVEQVWIGGLHLHHYWLGLGLIIAAFYIRMRNLSDYKTALLLGAGLALIVDEVGILLAGHTYHSWISYIALGAVNIGLFAVLNIENSD